MRLTQWNGVSQKSSRDELEVGTSGCRATHQVIALDNLQTILAGADMLSKPLLIVRVRIQIAEFVEFWVNILSHGWISIYDEWSPIFSESDIGLLEILLFQYFTDGFAGFIQMASIVFVM
jgi:hypothetical protein